MTRQVRASRGSRTAALAQTRAIAEHSRALVAQLRGEIGVPERPNGRRALVMLMGLPGTGKTHCARLLAVRLGAAHVATDHLRSRLFIAPSYAREENHAVFTLAEALVEQLLAEGHVVVLDATNLIADLRAPMEDVASRSGATLLHVLVVAEDADVRARLAARAMARADGDHSDADVGVYERMRARGFEAPERFVELHNGPDVAAEIDRIAASFA
ncbi:MAG TPA: ATP-binding protein [Candidatus Limnocylindria bacterium]